MRGFLLFFAGTIVLFTPQAGGQDTPLENQPAVRAREWKLESITLKDGRVLEGLIQAERKAELDFAEIVRQPGKPMYAVIRPVARRNVKQIRRLAPAERRELAAHLAAFRNRVEIEAGKMDDVTLSDEVRDGVSYLRYDGHWFTLLSTADDETTRRSVVRVEQIFRAYRHVLPPRVEVPANVEIVLFGSLAEYRDDLSRRQLEIENPAYYSANLNLIVAGSDLKRYAEQLARVRAQNEATRKHYESLQVDFRARLVRLADELKREGFTRDEIAEEFRLRRRAWDEECKAQFAVINEAQRRNDALFADVTRQMFARLNHEAFHAYVENFVYPSRTSPVPRWLNEGLAQVFENGQLDGDLLRIDAPHRDTLVKLQADLAGQPLPLADLLTAEEKAFLVTHADGSSRRHYLYSWGLAFYLAFHRGSLGTADFERYIRPDDESLSPIVRFERLVGEPLAEFEKRWRAEMRALRPPAR